MNPCPVQMSNCEVLFALYTYLAGVRLLIALEVCHYFCEVSGLCLSTVEIITAVPSYATICSLG